MFPFVIVTTQRSGSTWVVDKLHSHPQVHVYSELFLEHHPGQSHPQWAGDTRVPLWNHYYQQRTPMLRACMKPVHVFRYLSMVYGASGHPHANQDDTTEAGASESGAPGGGAARAVGMKVMYSQLRRCPWLLACMLVRRVALVHLIRHNLLDVVLSEDRVAVQATAHARDQEDVAVTRLAVDCASLLDRLERKERKLAQARGLLTHLGLSYLEVTYEALSRDPHEFERLQRFVGVAPHELHSGLRKLSSGSYRDRIENYDEVASVLRPTRFHAFLNGHESGTGVA